ncbi:MAG: hypothetical protein V2I27_12945 [Erythrobacter sp.]|jgi:hypothetical protein|nr:hypothetical protein [Erythrobacter sp.]
MITLLRITPLALAFLAILAAAPARAGWYEASSEHFVIYADDMEADVRLFAENLERYHAALERFTGRDIETPSPSNRVSVYVVGNAAAVEQLAGTNGIAGFYMPRAGNSAAFVQDIQNRTGYPALSTIVLQHEYAHHFLMSSARFAMPLWMNEGAAEFFGATGFAEDGSLLMGLTAVHRWRDLHFASNKGISVSELLDFDPADPYRGLGREAFYARSWLLYHFLSMREERAGQLRAYWLGVLGATPSLEAAQKAFGSLAQLERELTAHWRKGRKEGFVLAPGELAIGEVKLRRLPPGEAAMMEVRIRATRAAPDEESEALAQEARRIAQDHADEAAVLALLAQAEYASGDDAAAIEAAEAALALEPANKTALAHKGLALFRQAEALGDPAGRDAAIEAAMVPLRALNALENDHPLPLIMTYRSHIARGEEPSDLAKAAIARAAELAPFDAQLWLIVGLMHIHDGRIGEARAALAPLASHPHGGPKGQQMRDLVAMLQGRAEGERFPMLELIAQEMR